MQWSLVGGTGTIMSLPLSPLPAVVWNPLMGTALLREYFIRSNIHRNVGITFLFPVAGKPNDIASQAYVGLEPKAMPGMRRGRAPWHVDTGEVWYFCFCPPLLGYCRCTILRVSVCRWRGRRGMLLGWAVVTRGGWCVIFSPLCLLPVGQGLLEQGVADLTERRGGKSAV